MDILKNLDLLSVGTAIAGIGVLGFAVFLNNIKSITNRSFLFFSILTIFWGISNYFNYQTSSTEITLWFLRSHLFISVWHAFFFFQLTYIFPKETMVFNKKYKYLLLPFVAVVSILTLTPLVFVGISKLNSIGNVSVAERGPGILLFIITTAGLILSGISLLIIKNIKSKGLERKQYKFVLLGASLTFILLILFNLLLPAVFNNVSFIPLGALFLLPFIIFTFYSIYKHKLFNIKIIATTVLIFLLATVTFAEVILAGDNITLLLFRSVVFILVLLFGIFLIRGVLREVEQREKIENLATQLAVTNDELKSTNEKLKELDKLKTEFVSMATHQLRSPLTAIKGYASMLLENSFGPVETKARGAVEIIFQSSQKLVQVIEDFLNITRIDLGTMKYEKIQFDFGALVNNVVTELKPNIEKRGLKFSLEIAPKTNFNLVGDSGKLSQVISNLIDNAIKYTPPLSTSGEPGTIRISLDRAKGKVRLTVADNGAGIPAATIPKLFQKFIRADDAGKLNITGTGLGLYVAKQIMEAHNGKIWAESDGTGRGSRFIVEV